MLKLMRTTIIGGIIFLIPVAILVAVIGRGLKISGAIANPVADVLPVSMIGGVAVAHVLAIMLLLLICFLAGLLARLALARKAVDALEVNVLSKIPAYALLKTKTQSMLSPEDIEGMSVVIVRFDDLWQIGFEIERIEGGNVAVFLPGSPDPWSGSVCIAEADRVTPLDVPVATVVNMARRLGRGANEALRRSPALNRARGRDLSQPVSSAAPIRPKMMSSGGLTEVVPAVLVLQRDQHRLERAHQREHQHHGERQPEQQVQPDRRAVPDFGDQSQAHHDSADHQDDERRRAVAAVLRGQIHAARRTARTYRQETSEQRTLAARRAAAAQPRGQGGRLGISGTFTQ